MYKFLSGFYLAIFIEIWDKHVTGKFVLQLVMEVQKENSLLVASD
jgi:hypothetical protein